MKLNPQEIWEQIRLEREVPAITERIVEEYSTSTPESLKMALRQAVWEGICLGKGWYA